MEKLDLSVTDLVQTLAIEILKHQSHLEDIVFIGIVTRGYPIAQRIAAIIKKNKGIEIPVGKIDITLYRDDLELSKSSLKLKETSIPVSIDNKVVILMDDVLNSGRTVRAALDHVLDYGRPKLVRLAVLIDRGHRELPICADYAAKTIPTEWDQTIKVSLTESDGKDSIEQS